MAEIMMCCNVKCTIRERCFRSIAETHPFQTWQEFEQNEDESCKYFVEHVPQKNVVDRAVGW